MSTGRPPIARMQRLGHRGVVAHEVELRLAALGEQDLVGAGDPHLAPGELEHLGVGRPRARPYGACGSLTEPRLAAGADGGGTTGPMSPSGASSRSTMTGA